MPYCKRKDRKECWRFSDKGNIISAADVAAESRNLQFQKQSTQRNCRAGQWWGLRSRSLGALEDVAVAGEGITCSSPLAEVSVLNGRREHVFASCLLRSVTTAGPASSSSLASALSYLFITGTGHCCNANNNNEKEGIADITKLIKKLIFVLLLNKEADLDTSEAIHLIGYWLS